MKRLHVLFAVLVLLGCQSTGESGGQVFEGEPYGEPLTLMTVTTEQVYAAAAHRAEEQGLPFDSTAAYGATTIYRIRGLGALIRS